MLFERLMTFLNDPQSFHCWYCCVNLFLIAKLPEHMRPRAALTVKQSDSLQQVQHSVTSYHAYKSAHLVCRFEADTTRTSSRMAIPGTDSDPGGRRCMTGVCSSCLRTKQALLMSVQTNLRTFSLVHKPLDGVRARSSPRSSRPPRCHTTRKR